MPCSKPSITAISYLNQHSVGCMCAGGWFTLCLATMNAALMLLWFWGISKKTAFFGRVTVPLSSFLKLADATDPERSLTIAQQKLKLSHSGSAVKRAPGAHLI